MKIVGLAPFGLTPRLDSSRRVGAASVLVACALAAGCGESEEGVAPDLSPSEDTAPTDLTTPLPDAAPEVVAPEVAEEDVVVAADTEQPEDSATPPADVAEDATPDVAPPAPQEVRFVVLGDAGTGSATQRKVAVAIRDACARKGCDYAFMTGDNIYDVGVEGVHDALWDSHFEVPYADVDLPFYPVLGNHDNGGFLSQWLGDLFGGAGAEFERGDHQVAYTQVSDKWNMPGRTWDLRVGPAHFFGLDSNDMVWSRGNEDAEARTQIQVDTYPALIDASDATWKIVLTHHPWISNGRHGDAGVYEGLEEDITNLVAAIPFLGDLGEVVTGDGVLEALDTIVCGRADIHFAGHDHNLQWFEPTDDCPGTHFVVSGAGAKLTDFKREDRTTFQHDETAGFFWVYLKDRQIEVEAIDEDGRSLWSWQGFKD
jgi:tartrate-resistant acid phosphatase type 5